MLINKNTGLSILWPLFRFDWLRATVILTFVLSLVALLITAMSLYEQQLESSLAAKQPHISIQSISDLMAEEKAREWQANIIKLVPEVKAITPYLSETRFLNWKAGIVLPGQHQLQAYKKYSMTNTSVIGIDKNPPGILPLLADRAYVSGVFRQRLTPLEQTVAWYLDDESAVMNRVLDNSFYPPISQAVRLTTQIKDKSYSFNITQSMTDYSEKAKLYTSLKTAQNMFASGKKIVSGLYLNIRSPRDAAAVSQRLQESSEIFNEPVRISTWLDNALKQQQLIRLLKVVVMALSVIVAGLGLLLVLLIEYKTVVSKRQPLSVFYKLGLIPELHIWSVLFAAACFAVIVAQALSYVLSFYVINNVSIFANCKIELTATPWLLLLLVVFSFSAWVTVRTAVREDAIAS